MKWVAGTLAVLAIASGCVSLNKGSDHVALATAADGQSSKSGQPTDAVAAAGRGKSLRDASPKVADLTTELSAISLPAGADLLGERIPTRIARGSPPETPRPQPGAAREQLAAATDLRGADTPRAPAAPLAAAASDVKLPTMINGPAATTPVTPAVTMPVAPAATTTIAPAVMPPVIPAALVSPAAVAEPPVARPTAATVRMVNTKRISLNYEIKDVGPSGVSTVELWYTQDGKKWDKSDTINKPRPPFIVDLKDEGLYGFTLIARNGVGLGKRPPSPGEQPQIWVEVDTTKPIVKLLDIQAALAGENQHLNICWKATDANLGQRPVTISYAEQIAGPWMTIAASIENTGIFAWQLPANAAPRLFVRVEAVDMVGNVGVAQTPEPILLDLSPPSVSIVAVEPATK